MRMWTACLAALISGCALTSKATPQQVRYFSPESVETRAPSAAPRGEGPKLRFGRIASSPYLRSRIVYRHAAFELAAYEDRRWTEDPDAYLRRALARSLFDERRLVQAVGGSPPTLDVEVVAFEEVRRAGARFGRVELAYVLHDERDVLASGRLAAERQAASADMPEVVAAIAAALTAVTVDLSERIATRLGAPRAGQ